MSKSQDKILLEWADLHDERDALQAQRNQLLSAAKQVIAAQDTNCQLLGTEEIARVAYRRIEAHEGLRAAIVAAESEGLCLDVKAGQICTLAQGHSTGHVYVTPKRPEHIRAAAESKEQVRT